MELAPRFATAEADMRLKAQKRQLVLLAVFSVLCELAFSKADKSAESQLHNHIELQRREEENSAIITNPESVLLQVEIQSAGGVLKNSSSKLVSPSLSNIASSPSATKDLTESSFKRYKSTVSPKPFLPSAPTTVASPPQSEENVIATEESVSSSSNIANLDEPISTLYSDQERELPQPISGSQTTNTTSSILTTLPTTARPETSQPSLNAMDIILSELSNITKLQKTGAEDNKPDNGKWQMQLVKTIAIAVGCVAAIGVIGGCHGLSRQEACQSFFPSPHG